MKIFLLIGSLQIGGSERQISLLAEGLHDAGHQVSLFTLYSGGALWDSLVERKKVVPQALILRKSRWKPVVLLQMIVAIVRLRRQLYQEKPKVLYSVLYLTNLIAWAASLGFSDSVKVVWGVRSSHVPPFLLQQLPFRVGRFISRWIRLTIANSNAGMQFHRQQGYIKNDAVVVFNGVDVSQFVVNKSQREALRSKWKLRSPLVVVGVVGRIDSDKDFPTLLKAIALLAKHEPDVRFVVVGEGNASYVASLQTLAHSLQVESLISWVGTVKDPCEVYNAIDVLCSSSLSEGFPNVVAEAMACDVPCVVTDVGDSAYIVGDTGVVVPPQDPPALAAGIRKALAQQAPASQELTAGSRRSRISSSFSNKALVDNTVRVLESFVR